MVRDDGVGFKGQTWVISELGLAQLLSSRLAGLRRVIANLIR